MVLSPLEKENLKDLFRVLFTILLVLTSVVVISIIIVLVMKKEVKDIGMIISLVFLFSLLMTVVQKTNDIVLLLKFLMNKMKLSFS